MIRHDGCCWYLLDRFYLLGMGLSLEEVNVLLGKTEAFARRGETENVSNASSSRLGSSGYSEFFYEKKYIYN